MTCPVCQNAVSLCACKYASQHCGRCGQGIGAVAMSAKLLTALTNRPRSTKRQVGAARFLRRLSTEGGRIVCTNLLTPEQILDARVGGRMYVLGDGIGFVLQVTGQADQGSETK